MSQDEDEVYDFGSNEDDNIETQNLFVEAEEERNGDKELAATKFQEVIQLEEKYGQKDFTMRSLKYLIMIFRQLQQYDKMGKNIEVVIVKMVTASQDERNDTLKEVIQSILKIADSGMRNNYIDKILIKLWEDANLIHSWTRMGLFLISKYLELEQYERLNDLISKLKVVCKESDENNSAEASNILEIYSVEIQFYLKFKKIAEIKTICRKARKLNSVLNNPRIMGIIQETTGKLLLFDKFYDQGNNVMRQAFFDYQNTGNFAAQDVLQYWILSSILSKNEVNPADTKEARAYGSDLHVQRMFDLRRSWDENNLERFNQLVDDPMGSLRINEFMREFIPELKQLMALKKLKDIVYPNALEAFMQKQIMDKKQLEDNLDPKPFTPVVVTLPYSKLKLPFLKTMINAEDVKQVQNYLAQLILEKQIFGGIDDVEGVFEVYNVIQNESNNIEEKLFNTFNNWSNTVKNEM